MPKAHKAKSKKAKGTRLEKYVAKELETILGAYGVRATRTPMSGAIDRFKGDIFTNLPVGIECKNSERWTPLEWFKQAQRDTSSGNIPMLVMSRNNMKEPKAMLELNDLITLMDYAIQGGWFK